MKIIVIGNGKIGNVITEQLSYEGHEVTVIDQNESTLNTLQNHMDILCICGNGALKEVQIEAGIRKTDLLIAATAGDELNLLCCLIAKKLGAKHTIARVRNPEYADQLGMISEDLGLSMSINPELAAAHEIFSVLRFPGLLSVEEFAHGKFELAEFKLQKESIITSMDLVSLSQKYDVKALVCAVQRGKHTIIPNGDFILQPEDIVSFAASPMEAEKFLQMAGVKSRMPKDVIIVGAGRITYYLIRMMKRMGMHPIVIERDEKKAKQIFQHFPKALVISGDGTDREILHEEGIAEVDAFVALTGTDEVNILLSMYAQSQEVPKVVTKVSRMTALDLIDSDDLGSVISPKDIIASRIVSYVRAMEKAGKSNVETLYRICGGNVEALEFIALTDDRKVIGVPFKDLKLKANLLVCCLIRKGQIVIPGGEDEIRLGDRVIVVTINKHLKDLNDILE